MNENKYPISANDLTATIEALLDLECRYAADAVALARIGGEMAEELAAERLEQRATAARLADYYLHL